MNEPFDVFSTHVATSEKKNKQIAYIGLAVLLLIIVGIYLWQTSHDTVLLTQSDTTSQNTSSETTETKQQTIFVHVSGAVVHEGLYELTEGARVNDAIEAAGGFAEDANTAAQNLARVLSDGEQINVQSLSSSDATQSSTTASSTSSTSNGKVNINSADEATLQTLPGIGESTAKKIVSDRTANGAFQQIEDLKRVSGIGDKKFEALADLICV